MDPLTIAGIVLGLVAILGTMLLEGGNPMDIVLIPPLVLVFGGTLAVGGAGMYLQEWTQALKAAKVALLSPKPEPVDDLVATLVTCAEVARRDGLLALEGKVREVDDQFLRRGLELAIDGTDPEELAEILDGEVRAARRQGMLVARLFRDMGGYAPTIGIIGTVLGLVHVLSNLGAPEQLGHLIAGAFVATLWGVLSANVLWLPIANKLTRMTELQVERMDLVLEGILAIQSGSNPRMVDRKLRALLQGAGDASKAA